MAELVMRLPAITTEMDEGRLLAWMVTEGQAVKEGDPICEFTTDKVDTELESPYTGTITKLLVPEGGTARVGDAIALIDGDAPNFLGDLDAALEPDADQGEYDADAYGSAEHGDFEESVSEADDDPEGDEDGFVPAPRAVRLEAERRGIDLATITPTGSRGQVTMADLEVATLKAAEEVEQTEPAFDFTEVDEAEAQESEAMEAEADVVEAFDVEAVDEDEADVEAAEGEVDVDAVEDEQAFVVDAGEGDAEEAELAQSEFAQAELAQSEIEESEEPELEEPELEEPEPAEPAPADVDLPEVNDAEVDNTEVADAEPEAVPAVAVAEDEDEGEPSEAAQRPVERRGRRAERTGGRRRGRRRQDDTANQLTAEPTSSQPEPAPAPVIHEVRVEVPSEPPFTLYGQLDVTDLLNGQESGLALLTRLVWAYGQALWEQPEANAIWDTQEQTAVPLDTVYVDVGIETVKSTMETVPIAVPKDAPIAQIGLSVTNAYGLVRQGTPPEVHVPQRSATLIDLGPWRVERFTPVIQPPQVTALSVGEIQTVPSLVGRTVTIRQLITIGLTIDTRVLDPVQAAALLATVIDHASRGDGLDQRA